MGEGVEEDEAMAGGGARAPSWGAAAGAAGAAAAAALGHLGLGSLGLSLLTKFVKDHITISSQRQPSNRLELNPGIDADRIT